MHLTASAIPLRKIAHTTQSLTQLIRIAGVRQSHESLPFLAECLRRAPRRYWQWVVKGMVEVRFLAFGCGRNRLFCAKTSL